METNKTDTKKKLIITILISLLMAILTGVMCFFNFPQRLEFMAQDSLYHRPDVIPDNIKIIAIDEETLENLGPYSNWDRSYFAKLISLLNENPDTLCVVSGGQGINEPFSEAEGMADYLIEHGIEASRILLEDKATNTAENIILSKTLMEPAYNGVGIVTNNFHVFRAVQIAKAKGLKNVCGIAADSDVLYLPNNVLRECCGILKDWIMNNI